MLHSDTLLLENQHAHAASRHAAEYCEWVEMGMRYGEPHSHEHTRGRKNFFFCYHRTRGAYSIYCVLYANELRTPRRPREMQSISIWMRLHRTFLPKVRFFFSAFEMLRNSMDDKFQWYTIVWSTLLTAAFFSKLFHICVGEWDIGVVGSRSYMHVFALPDDNGRPSNTIVCLTAASMHKCRTWARR